MNTPDIPTRPGVSTETLRTASVRFSHVPEKGSIEIPYHDLRGNHTGFCRWRLARERDDGQKYHQAPGSGTRAYIPPQFKSFPPGGDLVIIEGEFKSLSLIDAGLKAIGLPSFNTYQRDDSDKAQLLAGIAEAIDYTKPSRILFVGDADTATNAEFSRQAHFLASKVKPLLVILPRIPFDGPGKGIDDCREALGTKKFSKFWSKLVASAEAIDLKSDFGFLAVRLLQREAEAIRTLTGTERDKCVRRVITMAATLAQLPLAIDRLKELAAHTLGVSRSAFNKAVSQQQAERSREARIRAESQVSSPASTKNDGKAVTPAPLGEAVEIERRYGPPLFLDDNLVRGINERYFAGWFQRAGDVLFEPDERSFYRYDSSTGLWVKKSDDAIREQLAATIREYGRETGIELASKITATKTGAVLAALRGIAERRGAFCGRRDYVHVANGVIRFDGTRVLLTGYRLEDFSRNRVPIPWQADADCPRFVNELLRAALPDEDVDLLQRCMGLDVAGVNPCQRLVILDGASATGKSSIARIIQLLVGIENTAQLRTALLSERFEIFRFVGKTLLLAPDVAGDFLNHRAAATVKALVGHDPLNAEAKGSNASFPVTGNWNILITSNTRLRIRLNADGPAWKRRLIIIRFDRLPPLRRVANFADILVAEEGPGILRWSLAGLLRARQEIASTGDLVLTPAQQARVDALLCESDSVRRFVEECTERGDGNVASRELVENYFRFCSVRDWTPQAARIVERELPDLLLEIYGASRAQDIARDGKSVRGWRSVVFTEEFSRLTLHSA